MAIHGKRFWYEQYLNQTNNNANFESFNAGWDAAVADTAARADRRVLPQWVARVLGLAMFGLVSVLITLVLLVGIRWAWALFTAAGF